MTRFRVWAPLPARVELLLDDERVPMDPVAGGWWEVDVPGEGGGIDYGFLLDGTGPFPDPRSPWQPRGVDGPSRTVDHAAFPWTDGGWRAAPISSAVLYELHVGTFTPAGTFDAAIPRLDHLRDLGVTHVELMPVSEFAGTRGWGYDGVDLFAPHHAYGGPDGLKRLVDACHACGLAVVLDVVYNHLGPTGNYLPRFGPYLTERHGTPWGGAVNFDGPASDEVRRFVCDNARMWLRDYHVDGLRIDAAHALVDASAEHILRQLAREVAALEAHLGRPLAITAESDLNDPRLVTAWEAGGFGLDAQWTDDVHHAVHVALTGEQAGYYADFRGLPDLARGLRENWVYAGQASPARGRRHGASAGGLPASRFVAFLQNHDQVGNRACGERLSMLVDPDCAAAAAAVLLLSPFVPLLFMGEEWAAATPFLYFTDQPAEIGEAIRTGRRAEFARAGVDPEDVPDPQARGTFERSKLDWEAATAEPGASMLRWYRDLLALRRGRIELAAGRDAGLGVDEDGAAGWIVMTRGDIAVACNLADEPRRVPLAGARSARVVLASRAGFAPIAGGRAELPPRSATILDLGEE